MFYKRQKKRRRLWLKLGIGISSAYMLFTIGNKLYTSSIFENSLKEQGISFNRFRSQPTIFNNILWYGVAETDTAFYMGFYSLLDNTNRITEWETIPKEESLIPMDDEDLATLAWFSDDYYKVRKTKDKGEYRYNDLRYALLDPYDAESSLFSFRVFKKYGRWDMSRGGPDFDEDATPETIFGPMIERLKGK
jgi:inner membrane protein